MTHSDIDILNNQAWKLHRNDPKQCHELAGRALSLAEEHGYVNGKCYALAALGASNVWLSNYDLALNYLFDAKKLVTEIGDSIKEAHIVYHIFCALYFLSDYERALEYALKNLSLTTETNDENGKANALNAIGTIYYTLNENQKAIDYLMQGYEICNKLDDKHLLARILDGIGTAYYNNKNIDAAIEYKKLSLEAARDSGVKNIESYALNGLALIYRDKGDFNKAKELFSNSLELRIEIEFKSGITETLFYIGDLHFKQNQIATAKEFLIESLSLAKEIDAKEHLYQIHELLSRIYEIENDIVNFKNHFELFYQCKEEFSNEQARQKIKSVEMQVRITQMEAERNLLETKNTELKSFSNDLELLNKLGKQITSLLSIESINKTVYEILNTIMEVDGFGIGVLNEEKQLLHFPGYIEKGIEQGTYDDLNNNNLLAVVCFKKNKEIIINDYDKEFSAFITQSSEPVFGEAMHSVIYLPLVDENKNIGVLTVQSLNKNAYTFHHINLLKNLCLYCVIALKNANLYEELEQKVELRTQEVIKQKEQLLKSYETTRLLSEIGQQLTSTTNFESIFRKLYENVNQLMDAGCFGVRIYHPELNEIHYRFEIEKNKIVDEVSIVSMNNANNYSVWCVKNKEVIFINDNIAEHKKWVQQIHVVIGEMPHSLIFFPMMIGERVIGVITVQSFEKNAYRPHHVDILKTLAAYTAIALENANLIENLEQRVKERTNELVKQKEQLEKTFTDTKLISEIGKEITSVLSLHSIAQKVYQNINVLMDATIFGIGIFNEELNELQVKGAMEKGKQLPDFSFTISQTDKLAIYCFIHSKEIIINDLDKEINTYLPNAAQSTNVGEKPHSVLYLPLVSKGKTIGTISVQSFNTNAYSTYDVNLLRNIALYTAIAIENANLYENTESLVIKRTKEIQTAYNNTKLLSQISKDIASSLSVETITEIVYKNVKDLMDTASFGVGLYNANTNCIDMPGFLEDGQKLDDFSFNVDDDRLAGWCFRNKKEIFTNDYPSEYHKYVKAIKHTLGGKHSQSIIYIPLFNKENIIGILTIQSYQKNAYTEYHLDILRSLSHVIASALENATLYASLEDKVNIRTAEVVKQKEIIEEKNKHITDSIIYAKRIQEALIPAEEIFCSYLQNSFVLYKPKDIVSGDFYWVERKNNKILFAVVDCTGHGVPGAFMSIIGFNGLNQIVNEYNIFEPAEILNKLNRIISNTLRQREEDSKIRDGMDMSICCVDLENNKLEYAGANNPIFIIRDNEIMELLADKHPIGNFIGEDEFKFTNNIIDLKPNDRIYLSSDGYADQFGGPKGKKFKYTQFREVLLSNHNKSMKDQKEILNNLFEEWRGDLEQIDDVCMIGIMI